MQVKQVAGRGFMILTVLLFGFMLGGFLGGRVFGGDGMGWDRLADALGGMMLGVIIALVVGIVAARTLTLRQCLMGAGAALAATVLLVLLIRVYPSKPMGPEPPTTTQEPERLPPKPPTTLPTDQTPD